MKLFLFLFIPWNIITFLMMGVDKRKAVKEKQRISEKTLLLCAFIFGALGVGCGMLAFHHKTLKARFRILVPVALVVNVLCIYGLWSLELLTW